MEPAFRVRAVCAGIKANVGAAVSVTGTVMVWLKPAPAADKVRLEVPAFAVLAALKVSVVVEPAVSAAGLTCVVTPVGAPATVRLSGALNEPRAMAQVSFVVVDWPTVTLMVEGVAAKVQTGGSATVKGTVTVFENPLPEAVTCSW